MPLAIVYTGAQNSIERNRERAKEKTIGIGVAPRVESVVFSAIRYMRPYQSQKEEQSRDEVRSPFTFTSRHVEKAGPTYLLGGNEPCCSFSASASFSSTSAASTTPHIGRLAVPCMETM